MAHEIFGNRFLDSRQPAWHGLGVHGLEVSAKKAFETIGEYAVETFPINIMVPDGSGGETMVTLPDRAIMRHPTTDDPEWVKMGIVGPDYNLITPWEFATIWDEFVGVPVETMGSLKRGSTIFISTHLPTLDVKGDELENYLLAVSPMTGSDAARVSVTPVRVVCQNTLVASERVATEMYRIIHDQSARVRLGEWLKLIYQQAEHKAAVLREAFEIMAGRKITGRQAIEVINQSYPYKTQPRDNAPETIIQQRMGRWEEKKRIIDLRRTVALDLFNGEGTGMQSVAARGTAWGIYNAIVELEDYRRGRNEQSIAADTLFGKRAQVKAAAFEASYSLAATGFTMSAN